MTGQDVNFPIDVQDSFGLVASNCDRSMAELYTVADKCGSPRGLVDELIGKMKQEAHLLTEIISVYVHTMYGYVLCVCIWLR